MREIKFRAWDELTKEMIDCAEWRVADFQHMPTMRHPLVMQFTGLHDKNGKEIYEGDIVRYRGLGVDEMREVVFADGSFHLSKHGPVISERANALHSFEVIGNIYENPELLK